MNIILKDGERCQEANRWRRISTMLFDAIHDPEERDKAIETYLNYAFPDDDE